MVRLDSSCSGRDYAGLEWGDPLSTRAHGWNGRGILIYCAVRVKLEWKRYSWWVSRGLR